MPFFLEMRNQKVSIQLRNTDLITQKIVYLNKSVEFRREWIPVLLQEPPSLYKFNRGELTDQTSKHEDDVSYVYDETNFDETNFKNLECYGITEKICTW